MSATYRLDLTAPEGYLVDRANVYTRTERDGGFVFLGETTGSYYTVTVPESGYREFAVGFVIGGVERSQDMWPVVEVNTKSKADLESLSAVTGFTVAQDGAFLIGRWDANSNTQLSHYEIRYGADSETAVPTVKVAKPATETRWGWWTTGSSTFHIAAVTKQGKRSSWVPYTITVVAEDYMPAQGTHNEATSFGGTKSGMEVSGSTLQITALPTNHTGWTATFDTYNHEWWYPHQGTGTYTTSWQDVGSVVDEQIEVALTTAIDKSSDTSWDNWYGPVDPPFVSGTAQAMDAPDPHYDEITFNGSLINGLDIKVEVDTAQDGVPTSDGWRLWSPGGVYRYRQARLRFTFDPQWPLYNMLVSAMTWKRRRLNKKDEGRVTLGATSTTVSFNQTFTTAPNISLTFIGKDSMIGAVTAVTASQFELRLYDETGALQSSGKVDWIATGV